MIGRTSTLGLLAALAMTNAGHASPLYFQGFESDTSGWFAESGGDGNGAITQEVSGGGPLALPAFQGTHYADVHNGTNAYQPGYGTGGFSYFQGNGVTPPPYPGHSFSQSISVYVNVSTPPASVAGVPSFWIDMSPSSVVSDLVGCFPAACSDEHSFQLTYSGSSVAVNTDGGPTALTITQSGWYTFAQTYAKGATPSSLVTNELNVFDASGNLLSSTAALGNSDGGTLTSGNLAGPGYVWLPVWQDGFSGDNLGIDNVRAGIVPEPATIALLAPALLFVGLCGTRRRRARSSVGK